MEFIINGEKRDLTRADVSERLRGHEPDRVFEYSVVIDGREWPVKQAFGIAAGLPHAAFTSQTARRQLRKLGFPVDMDQPPVPAAPSPSTRSSRGFDPTRLTEIDTVSATTSFTWLHAGGITLDSDGWPSFPPLPRAPGLYRFSFRALEPGGRGTVYVGESVDLARRGSNYRNAKTDRSSQRTSRRIHKELVRHLRIGGEVAFSIATDVVLGVDGDPVDLRWKSARRLAENAAVLLAQLDGEHEVLNIDADLGAAEPVGDEEQPTRIIAG
ncbi:hypothetical protein SAMN05216282_11733 [Cryobacterium psychrotolerans]|uniref:Uncharacterized protein n=1 Tax=Cryobacterium psychrotolerans TaxID=386301 RepID=A0A1G9FNA8_9MICO|nr:MULTISPECIES: hypothetical protein [Cryobacterium]TFD47143.1 hypothetical protein E3T33_03710 [Cryobacterium sp. TMT1-2-1]TFD88714.1 hypothetical protein E3T56_03940 [Cryobacterium psychrotolerans]SDK89874.1 hypothetical protein SAMN05216282_11733 [Cryobacterium psychrotolerans]